MDNLDVICIGAAIVDIPLQPVSKNIFDVDSYPLERIAMTTGGDAINEATIISLVTTIGYGWTGILLYTGTMTTHQYSGGKTFLILLAILLGMVIIVFLGILFFFLVQEIWNFIYTIYMELELRS